MVIKTTNKTNQVIVLTLFIISSWVTMVRAGDIYIGTSSVDITPKLPFALLGQFHLRIAYTIKTPLTANVVALESRVNGHPSESAILVSCDLTVITPALLSGVRNELKRRIPQLDVSKVILTATHTHTAPVLGNENLTYPIPKEGVTQIDETLAYITDQIAKAIQMAWKSRSVGSVTWGLSHAVIGYNRRSLYANGTAAMYGDTRLPNYRGPEGYEDHDINTLFFWNKSGKLIAAGISVACPAQEVGGDSTVNADFWHDARIALKKRFGDNLSVIAWVAAAGDQSPSLMYRHAAEERMHKLRKVSRMEEIGRRITKAVEDAYDVVKNDRHRNVVFIHKIDTLHLPMRLLAEWEYNLAKKERDTIISRLKANPELKNKLEGGLLWYQQSIDRYEKQKINETKFEAEIHVLRIGDVVICTNPFELFVDYGIRIQARSKALQTFVVQLAGCGNYVPTEKAIKGGGYSAMMTSSWVGHEGGDILIEHTVNLIDSLFGKK